MRDDQYFTNGSGIEKPNKVKKVKTKYIKMKIWAIACMICMVVGGTLIAATSYLTNRGYDLPPWI